MAKSPFKNIFMSVYGTDCRVSEPQPFHTKWYSHKFNGPGLRYVLVMSIGTKNIVWINGPFPCGSFPDVRIFKAFLQQKLNDDETLIADRGYRNIKCVYEAPGHDESISSAIRAIHKVVYRRLKQFCVLRCRFRHRFMIHPDCFHAVSVLTYIMIGKSDSMFYISYD